MNLPIVRHGGAGTDIALIEAMLHAVWLVDTESLRIVAANEAAGRLLRVPARTLVGQSVTDLASAPEDECFWREAAAGLADSIESDTLLRRHDGMLLQVSRRVSRVPARGSQGALFVVAVHDRSAQVRLQSELEVAMAELHATLESTADGILVTDLSGRIRNINQRFASLWGVPRELLMQRIDDGLLDWMRHSVSEPSDYMRRLAALDDDTMARCTDLLTLNSGLVIERITQPLCSLGRPIGRLYSFRDVTERMQSQQRIETLSRTDLLTSLSNRSVLTDRIEHAISMARRDGSSFALLFVDLDRFKQINETLGHAFGDRVLLDVAGRLQASVRQVDTVARLGGDEFVVLAHRCDAEGAVLTAQRLLDALHRPYTQGDMTFTVTASIGIALFPDDGPDGDRLLNRAGTAMHEAKQAGRAGYRLHRLRGEPGDVASLRRMRLDHAMRLALSRGQFRLHYQPQVDLGSGRVRGAEALIRWNDAEMGEVAPGEFIPVAEATGFIVPIGNWVLVQAVTQAASWHAVGLPLTIAVNVSALQFHQPGFVEGVARALRGSALPAAYLELELTESILVQDAQEALRRIQALAELGVKLSIDDFGTGYSSLAYLKRLPIDRLKIDRSFVRGLPADESDAGIVHAIVAMGRALRVEIVAEGVETEGQRQFLHSAGCEQYQGFLFAPALAAAAFEQRARMPLPSPAVRLARR